MGLSLEVPIIRHKKSHRIYSLNLFFTASLGLMGYTEIISNMRYLVCVPLFCFLFELAMFFCIKAKLVIHLQDCLTRTLVEIPSKIFQAAQLE